MNLTLFNSQVDTENNRKVIRQYDAQILCDGLLSKFGLHQQGWRASFTKVDKYIACCVHADKRILISVPHLNARSESELRDTMLHEIAHALVGYAHGHDEIWKQKALEIGCHNPAPCAASNVDAGRSINVVETKAPKKIKSIVKTCPVCGEVAEEIARFSGNNVWLKLKCGHLISQDKIKNPLDGLDTWTSRSGKQVYPFQVEGIKFVANANGRCLIADEPGLGKTIQALGALKFFPEMRPAIWVCKTTLKLQAAREAADWGGMLSQVIEHGKTFIIPNMDIYIISMDLLRRVPTEKLEEIPFKTVVADEIQHFKNPDSSRTAELRKLVARAEYFLPLSGTPWKNRGSEYFPVLNMLRPEMFPSFKYFKSVWVNREFDKKTGKERETGIRDIPRFREKTKDFIIRRMRDDVLPDLPKIQRNVRFVDMDEESQKFYDKQELEVANALKASIIDDMPIKSIASMIMRLKHTTGLAKVSAAIDDITEWLENVPDDYEKMTVFHHHIDVGDNLQKGSKGYEGLDKILVEHGYNPSLRLFGGRSPEERDRIITEFREDPKNRIMIASTLASGEGLNIQFCQNAYMLERQWNPQNEEQAEMRFSRPLTKSDLPEYLYPIADRKVSIQIPYFVAGNTVDDILTDIVEKKRIAFKKSMNAKDEFITWDEADIVHELARAIIRKNFKKTA